MKTYTNYFSITLFSKTKPAKKIYNLSPNRDQNFGLNELAAVQDVRNEFNLQDIDGSGTGTSGVGGGSSDLLQSSNLFKEKGKK